MTIATLAKAEGCGPGDCYDFVASFLGFTRLDLGLLSATLVLPPLAVAANLWAMAGSREELNRAARMLGLWEPDYCTF